MATHQTYRAYEQALDGKVVKSHCARADYNCMDELRDMRKLHILPIGMIYS
jgi:hypothetical protein